MQAMQAVQAVQHGGGASLVRRQIEQLQSSASAGRLPPHLSGTPLLRPRLTRARTNLDVVWRALENRDPRGPSALAAATTGALPVVVGPGTLLEQDKDKARSATHLEALVQLQRQPLRAIQAAGAPGQDAVYQTIDEKGPRRPRAPAPAPAPALLAPPHYDKPVSPPVPVDPSKRKRKAGGQSQEGLGPGSSGATASLPRQPRQPRPPAAGSKPSANKAVLGAGCGHRSLPRRLTGVASGVASGMAVVEIDVDLGVPGGIAPVPVVDPAVPVPNNTLPLPLKKAARGGQLWRRFSSFSPCSRWEDWSGSSKKGDVKRPLSGVKSPSDQRPPVPNRPLPPTPRPSSEKTSVTESPRGALLPAKLEHQPWFHNVDRRQAEELIKNGIDGYFLIRPSSQSHNPLTLTLWYNQRVYNISVRQRKDSRIALGFEKPDEQSFLSIEEMINNYQSENLLLFSRNERTGRTVLTKSPPKKGLQK